MHDIKNKHELSRKEQLYYFVTALFLNITLVTDLLRGINQGWFGLPVSVVEDIKVFVYVAIFVYVLFLIFTKPIPKNFLYISLIFVIVLCASILATPGILIIMPTFLFMFFSRCLPGYYIAYSIKEYGFLFKALIPYVWIGLGYALLMVTGIRGETSSLYFSFGYNLLLPSLIALVSGFVYKKRYILIGSFLALCIIGFGGRGALVCLFVSLLLLFLLFSNSLKLYKKISILSVAIVSTFLVFINYKNILLYLEHFFHDSRTLRLLLSSSFWDEAGRFSFFNKSLELVSEAPFAFRGILSDRILLATKFGNSLEESFGSYAHNIFLEFFIHYGIVLGVILLIGLLFLLIKSLFLVYKSNDVYLKIIYSVIIGYNFHLLFSGSYISAPIFWVGLGLMVSIIEKSKLKRLRRTNSDKVGGKVRLITGGTK